MTHWPAPSADLPAGQHTPDAAMNGRPTPDAAMNGRPTPDLGPGDGPITRRSLSVVLPAFNEEAVIAETVARCVQVLAVLAPDYEIIVVDDGSRDRTGEVADALATANPRVRVVHNRPNRGYGGALIAGFRAVRNELTFFMDADGQFDIADIAEPLRLREQGHRAVLGYRAHRRDPLMRLINAWGWNMLVHLLYRLPVRDVDCAFKLYDTNLVRVVDVQAEGAVINTEMLAKLACLGQPFTQVPVRHFRRRHGNATGANPRVILRAFRELIGLQARLRGWSATLPPPDAPALAALDIRPSAAAETVSMPASIASVSGEAPAVGPVL